MNIYDGLLALTDEHEAFYFQDFEFLGESYRVFNYRMGSYAQWLLPYSLECRGITFHVDTQRIVSRPIEKFFNLNENPFTMDLDLSTVIQVWDKMDGSLISTMDICDVALEIDGGGGFWLKSKGSLFSDQAVAANKLILADEYADLYKFCADHVVAGNTVIMEYTGPTNRIVLSYEGHELTVLAIRDDETGDYVALEGDADALHFVEDHIDGIVDTEEFVLSVADMEGIEGYVVQLASGLRFKIKTEWYRKLHFIKDSISSQRRLFEAVVYETSDDVKAAFFDDPIAIAIIEDMEAKVSVIYNHMVDVVERYYLDNKHLDRKDYAIKGQADLEKLHFGLAMSKYIGREVDYKATMVKHRKDFGIKDDPES